MKKILPRRFRRCVRILAAMTLFSLAAVQQAGAERFLFIPLDNRPVTRDYTVDTFHLAGHEIITPPETLLASHQSRGDAAALENFLDQEARGLDGAVVSLDSLIYGGLVTSRTHEFSDKELEERIGPVLHFKENHPGVPLYGFVTVMRSPKYSSAPQEPAYYAEWGPRLFAWGELRDRQEQGLLTRKEQKQLALLEKEIPAAVQKDLLERRRKNRDVILALVDAAKAGRLDYLLIGRDDSSVYSEARRDARAIAERIGSYGYKIRSLPGADELGMVLLSRAVSRSRGLTPLIHAWYTEPRGASFVSALEDISIGENVRQHILAAGGYPARLQKRADLVLAVSTPYRGVTHGADTAYNTELLRPEDVRFLDRTEKDVREGYSVGVADTAYLNGSSDALVRGLFARRLPDGTPLAYGLASYAGWNTCGNTLGYAVAQGLAASSMPAAARREMLDIRYLDDWAYQAHARQDVRYGLTYPKQWENGGMNRAHTEAAEAYVTESIRKTAGPVMGKQTVDAYTYTFPWQRTFEIAVRKGR